MPQGGGGRFGDTGFVRRVAWLRGGACDGAADSDLVATAGVDSDVVGPGGPEEGRLME